MSRINTPLTEAAQKSVGAALQGALVDIIDLSLSAKQAHWNVYGPHFRSLHLQLDETVATARAAGDVIAERASAIGVAPDGRASSVAAESGLPKMPDGAIKDDKVVTLFIEIYDKIIARMRERIEATADTDPVTQDRFISIAHDLEKERWMYQTQAS